MPTYQLQVSDKVVELVENNAAILQNYGYDPSLPDPVGALLYGQATSAIRSLITSAIYQAASDVALTQAQAIIDNAFSTATDATPTPADPPPAP